MHRAEYNVADDGIGGIFITRRKASASIDIFIEYRRAAAPSPDMVRLI